MSDQQEQPLIIFTSRGEHVDFGVCPAHLKVPGARIFRVDTYGSDPTSKSFDCEWFTVGRRAVVSMHLTTRLGDRRWAVVTMGGTRVWRYLALDGWVDAIADSDPRASVFFAIQRAELTFDGHWEAIYAAHKAMIANEPTKPFRYVGRIFDEWGAALPYTPSPG